MRLTSPAPQKWVVQLIRYIETMAWMSKLCAQPPPPLFPHFCIRDMQNTSLQQPCMDNYRQYNSLLQKKLLKIRGI